MGHFYGSVQGHRGEATRLGTKNSGVDVSAAGWSLGAKISMFVDQDGRDTVRVYATRGSAANSESVLIAEYTSLDNVKDMTKATGHTALVEDWHGKATSNG